MSPDDNKSAGEKAADILQQINLVAGGINPLIPLVGGLVALIAGLIKPNDPGFKTFQEEVVKLDATIGRINEHDAEWRRQHP